jgi:putative membrane protein insertion efficiency factor
VLSRAADLLFAFYRLILSPFAHFLAGPGMGCRFEPSCSRYAQEALQRHGWFQGGYLALNRLCRCQPFSKSSLLDPVPEQFSVIRACDKE